MPSVVKERPILFSAPMVRALLDGSKTQTRRTVKFNDRLDRWDADGFYQVQNETISKEPWNEKAIRWNIACPFGQPGDRLWVRETFAKIIGQTAGWIETDYRATYTHGDRMGDLMGVKKKWTPSIFMPRDASRITLEITGVRVELLQEISEADAIAEGVQLLKTQSALDRGVWAHRYAQLWESINGPGSWKKNPWVWVLEFQKVVL